jgi:hypothetical protein
METMNVRILVSLVGNDPDNGPSFSYGKGFEGHIPADRARSLVKAGHAELLESPADIEIETRPLMPKYEKRKK